jgi:peptide/nickel transport system ATP-binding protein
MKTLLDISQLRVSFRDEAGAWREAVRGVSFTVPESGVVALVGESGSGKSVSSLAVMGLLPSRGSRIEAGSSIRFAGQDVLALTPRQRRQLCGADISMVFQEPMSSLNPVFRAGDQVAEMLRLHEGMTQSQALERARALFEEVGLPNPGQKLRSYPHGLSGGQQQRVMIAMAIACKPKLLIADEPTTALDVTIQRQILDLLADLRSRYHMALLFITHDLGVVSDIAEHVVVMRDGQVREQGPASEVLSAPKDAYTQALLACRPPLQGRPLRLPQVEDFLGPGAAAGAVSPPTQERVEGGRFDPYQQDIQPKRLYEAKGLREENLTASHAKSESLLQAPLLQAPLLQVVELSKTFQIRQGLFGFKSFEALKNVSFSLNRGETLGVVGESGCGKTTLGLSLMRLQAPFGGKVVFDGIDLAALSETQWQAMRRRIQIVFQNPYASLNPRFTVAQILTEPMHIHGIGRNERERLDRAIELMSQVGLPVDALNRYPHEFSGGQRQRIAIARCLALEPELLILDESVSALDVSVQAQVLNLLKDLQSKMGMAYLFISHDLAVVRYLSNRILVMNAGEVVEEGAADSLFDGGKHHRYTERLLASIPGRQIQGSS